MDDIKSVVQRAGSRLFVIDLLRALVVTFTFGLALVVLTRIAQKLFPFEVPWVITLVGVGVAALLAGVVIAYARRRDEVAIAREIDERAGLRATLGTALYLGKPTDAWDHAVIENAREKAKRVVVRDAVPVTAPARWPVPVALLLALAAIWWIPSYDVTGLFEDKQQQQQAEQELVEVKSEIQENRQKLESQIKKAGLQMEEPGEVEAEDPLDPMAPTTPEQIRRAEIKRLTMVQDQLQEKLDSQESAEVQAMQDAMRRLTDPGPGPASEMARSLANGDFSEAKEQLEKLMDEIKNGEMTKEEKRQAADQLEQLQQQMDQMAQQQEQIQEQLQSAGFSEEQAKQMAANAEQMEQQLDQNDSLSQEQKDQLQKAANAQRKASDAMSALSQSMGQMAQGMQNSQGQQGEQGMEQAGESMSGQLSNMQQMKSEMMAAQSALGECQSQMASMGEGLCEGGGNGNSSFGGQNPGGNGQWAAGSSMAQGQGSGGPGQGNGAGPSEERVDVAWKSEKSNVNTTEGPIIASTMVFGQQVRGESKAAFSAAVSAARAESAEAIENRRVPREHENAVQAYFGTLQQQAAEQETNDG